MLKMLVVPAAASSGCRVSLLEIHRDKVHSSINKLAHPYRKQVLDLLVRELYQDPGLYQCSDKPLSAMVSSQS
jgi:hypothetical protein